jgi:hypothetical protein
MSESPEDDDDDDVPEAMKRGLSSLQLSSFSHSMALQFLRRGELPHVVSWLNELSSPNSKGFTTSALSPPSKWQRGCPEIIPGLRSVPVWREGTEDSFMSRILQSLRESYLAIKEELLSLRGTGGFQEYLSPRWDSVASANGDSSSSSGSTSGSSAASGADLLHGVRGTSAGLWSIYYLYLHNSSYESNLARCPLTRALLDSFPKNRMYGHAMFSALAPGTHVATHTGPTNKKLRFHLPLIVPPPPLIPPSPPPHPPSTAEETASGSSSDPPPPLATPPSSSSATAITATPLPSGTPPLASCTLRVGSEMIPVVEGEPFAFDDSFQHEAWNSSPTSPRLVLIFDVWHPDLTDAEVKFLQFVRAGHLRMAQAVKGHVEEKHDFYAVLEQSKSLPVADERVFGGGGGGASTGAGSPLSLSSLHPLAAPPVKDD